MRILQALFAALGVYLLGTGEGRALPAPPAESGTAGGGGHSSSTPAPDVNDATPQEKPAADAGWLPPTSIGRQRAEPYLAALHRAEDAHGIPRGLLVRVAWQESRFRPDIISGDTRSPVGALGLMQVMPATAADPGFGVQPLNDPTDPWASIEFAADYLAAMRRFTGSWQGALAAYNWGPGFVVNRGMDQAPAETRNYVAEIAADVPEVITV